MRSIICETLVQHLIAVTEHVCIASHDMSHSRHALCKASCAARKTGYKCSLRIQRHSRDRSANAAVLIVGTGTWRNWNAPFRKPRKVPQACRNSLQ